MAKLDRYQEITRRLSLVKGLDRRTRRGRWRPKARPSSTSTAACTPTECAPAQHNIQLAYDLVTGTDAATRAIRDNMILVLVFANPDGMDMVAEWYHPNVGTPYEVSPMPWLYNKYVGHDNNRDSYMDNLIETQYLTRIVNQEWFPEVLYNHHQTAPFPARIWIHPAAEPTNSQRPPAARPLAEPDRHGDGRGVRPRGPGRRDLADGVRHAGTPAT